MAQRQIIIHRTNSKETRIQNRIIWDSGLSTAARFALIAMLSLPDSWDYSVRGMAVMLSVTKDTMAKYLRELETAGYLKRTRPRGESGRFSKTVYFLTDTPGDFEKGETPRPENDGGEARPDFPAPVNPPQKKRRKQKNVNPPIVPQGTDGLCEAYAKDDAELLEALSALLENRAALNKPVRTAKALNGILAKLDRLSAGDRRAKLAMLDNAVQHNWLSVYPLRPDELPGGISPGYDEEGYDGI